jgi:hypothetical protein
MPDPLAPPPADPTPEETDRVLEDLKAQIVQLRARVAAEWRRVRTPDGEPSER